MPHFAGAAALSMILESARRAIAAVRSPSRARPWRSARRVLQLVPVLVALAPAALLAETKKQDVGVFNRSFAGISVPLSGSWSITQDKGNASEVRATLELKLNLVQANFHAIVAAAAGYRDPCGPPRTRTAYLPLDEMKDKRVDLTDAGGFTLKAEVEFWSCTEGLPTSRVEWEERPMGGATIRVPVVKTYPGASIRSKGHRVSFDGSFALKAGLSGAGGAQESDVAVRAEIVKVSTGIGDVVNPGLEEFTGRLGRSLSEGLSAKVALDAFPKGFAALKPRLVSAGLAESQNMLVIRYTFVATAEEARVNAFMTSLQ